MVKEENRIRPLVSVIVITYNSASFIVETLESINAQTYENIELIVSDDASKDDTAVIVRKWINEKKKRFKSADLIISEENRGIPANCNMGLNRSHGEWIKYIAGDDILSEDCIEKNVSFILNTDFKAVFSRKVNFSGDFKQKHIISISRISVFNNRYLTADEQYRLLLRGVGCPPNTMFLNREALISVNGYDEEFPLFEDWPMNVRLTKAGYRIGFMDEITFYYRIHLNSVFHKGSEKKIYRDFESKSYHPAYMKYAFPSLSPIEKILYRYKASIIDLFINTKLNRVTFINRALNFILLSPYKLYRAFILFLIRKQINARIRKEEPIKTQNQKF